jgi:hypothetical protein
MSRGSLRCHESCSRNRICKLRDQHCSSLKLHGIPTAQAVQYRLVLTAEQADKHFRLDPFLMLLCGYYETNAFLFSQSVCGSQGRSFICTPHSTSSRSSSLPPRRSSPGLLLLARPLPCPRPPLPPPAACPFCGGGLTKAKSTDMVWSSSFVPSAPLIAACASRRVGYSMST